MAHDREVLRMIWEAQVAICFHADPEEIVGLQPEAFFLLVPRLSYLPLVTDKVKKYFSRFIASEHQDGAMIWFDSNGTVLKPHYPLGVLYDMLHSEDDGTPWRLTIHFTKFPEDTLIKLNAKDVLESHFMSCLKEADVLKHRGQIISAMQKKDHNQLWLGLTNDKFDQFWAVNRRLMEPNSEQGTFKNIPARFYDEDFTFTQKLILPLTECGQKRKVADLLADLSTPERKVIGFRTHGIHVHDETQLQWMSEHLSYPDNFLHLFMICE